MPPDPVPRVLGHGMRPQGHPSRGILDVLDHPSLLGPYFEGGSWDNWKLTLRAVYGMPLSATDRSRFHELAGRDPPPGRVREAWFAIGRRGGKDSIASGVAVHAAVFGGYERYVRPGERPVVLLLASTKEQASGLLSYVRGYLDRVPLFASLVRRSAPSDGVIELSTGVDIVVSASDYRTLRGRTVAVAILNEVAFFRDESGRFQNPDREIYSAVLPSLMTLRAAGSLLIGISSVHRKLGLLYDKIAEHEGKPDPNVLAIRAPSRTFNPTLDPDEIAADTALDPAKALAEWESIWRTDISAFVDRAVVEALVDVGIRERPHDPAHRYLAFADEAGGSGQDSSTLSIVHLDAGVIVQDIARRWTPPFSPTQVIAENAAPSEIYNGIRGIARCH